MSFIRYLSAQFKDLHHRFFSQTLGYFPSHSKSYPQETINIIQPPRIIAHSRQIDLIIGFCRYFSPN